MGTFPSQNLSFPSAHNPLPFLGPLPPSPNPPRPSRCQPPGSNATTGGHHQGGGVPNLGEAKVDELQAAIGLAGAGHLLVRRDKRRSQPLRRNRRREHGNGQRVGRKGRNMNKGNHMDKGKNGCKHPPARARDIVCRRLPNSGGQGHPLKHKRSDFPPPLFVSRVLLVPRIGNGKEHAVCNTYALYTSEIKGRAPLQLERGEPR